jgi:Uma2 family endonuclease
MATPLQSVGSLRPLYRREYDQLVALGAFRDERIELLYGALVPMSPIGPPHSSAVQKLTKLLILRLGERAAVRPQLPFAALETSEPEPDLAVLPSGEYASEHPEQAFLLIEVAESSLAVDRGLKARLYAECGVPEYWIVNLVDRQIEAHHDPAESGYRRTTLHRGAEAIPIAAFPDVLVRVDEVLPST